MHSFNVATGMFHASNFFGISNSVISRKPHGAIAIAQHSARQGLMPERGLRAWLCPLSEHMKRLLTLFQKPYPSYLGSGCHSLATPGFLTDLLHFMGKGLSLLFAWLLFRDDYKRLRVEAPATCGPQRCSSSFLKPEELGWGI